jgi:hypothetical protein
MLKTQTKRPPTHLITINTNRNSNNRIPRLRSKLLPRTRPISEQQGVELDRRRGGIGLVGQRGVYAILAGLRADIL